MCHLRFENCKNRWTLVDTFENNEFWKNLRCKDDSFFSQSFAREGIFTVNIRTFLSFKNKKLYHRWKKLNKQKEM